MSAWSVISDGDTKLVRLDQRSVSVASDETLLFACVRNESARLPYFLEYYRSLGINRFFFVDNGSNDGSQELLLAQSDVHVFGTEESYATSNYGVKWLNMLLDRFGSSHWTLTVDADELLVYPLCEQAGLKKLSCFLDEAGSDALATFLLDMYSDKPIAEVRYEPGRPFRDFCNYFDADTYHQKDSRGLPLRGGARHRLFWAGSKREKPSPVLKKIPLVKWRPGLAFEASTHVIEGVTISSITGVLQHFKFFSDFFEIAKQESLRKEHWDDAAQYVSYWDILSRSPNLSAFFENSVLFESSQQLIDLGLARVSISFREFVERSRVLSERSKSRGIPESAKV